jgi:Fe-S-cluster containining protein
VIFADVQLQAGDDPARLQALGLPLRRRQQTVGKPESESRSKKFSQPCTMFDGCRCQIYAERPTYCREFECALLKNVNARRMESAAALRLIGTARQRAEKVRRLLRALGDTDEHLALSLRFRRTSKRIHRNEIDEQTADTFGELTLAVHDLNVLLSEVFYPGRIAD